MASGIYNCFKGDLMEKQVNLASGGDTFKVALYDGSHSFTAANTVYTTSNELATAGNYVQGGAILSGQSVTTAATTYWDATDTTWSSASFTAYHAVIYDSTNSNSLVCSFDFGGAKTVSSGTFTIQWNASGIISLT